MENTTRKLSIITVNLNNAEGLRKTIESVINQSYTNFEHIIIDGGSTDGSVEVIKEYEALYKKKHRHLHWVSEPDKGIYNGMNKGINVATGAYFLFLNSGDQLAENNILHSFTKLNPIEDIIYGDLYINYDGVLKEKIYPDNPDISYLYYSALPHPSMFFNKNIFLVHGKYDERFNIVADWAYYLKLMLLDDITFRKINLKCSIFNYDGISSSSWGQKITQTEREIAINEIIPRQMLLLINKYQILEQKYNGLMSSGSVRLSLKVSGLLKKAFKI